MGSYLSLNHCKAEEDLRLKDLCSPLWFCLLQWSRAREQLSTKEVVRRISRGRPVERSGPRPSSAPGRGRGCGGRLPSDPQEPADRARVGVGGAGSDSRWNRTKAAAGQRRLWAHWNWTELPVYVDYFLLFVRFMSILNPCALSSCNYFF